jgi:ABC-type transport system substrate-binding protein
MFFDVTKAPFDDVKVRLAFAKAVDREQIVSGILAPLAVPAYSMLAPGFPDENSAGLQPIQGFDAEAAKALLAEAGFPNAEGFPKQTLIARGASDPVVQAVVASITQTLGIEADIQYLDVAPFHELLGQKPTGIPWGYVSYGFDYLDATNMLGVWRGGGQYNWANADFDKLILEGGQITDDAAARTKAMQDAEKMLVEQVPGIFVYHALAGQLHKPYRKGAHLEPNKNGYTGIQFGGESTVSDAFNFLYQGKDVLTMRK